MRSIYRNLLCTAVTSTVFAGTALAQDCASAPTASDGANPFTTVSGSGNLAMPAGNGCGTAHTIFNVTYFTYTAAVSGAHTLSLCGGSTWDTRIAVLNSCDPATGVLGCNDDACGLQSLTVATLTAGQTYKIAIGGFGSASFGTGTLAITPPSGGGGDNTCENPGTLSLGENAFSTTASGFVVDLTGFCDPGTFGDDRIYNSSVYTFTPAESGSYRFSTCGTASFDTRLAIMPTCDPSAGVVACNDDGPGCTGFTSLIAGAELTGGVEYTVIIGGYSATTPTGTGTLAISLNGGGGGGGCAKATEVFDGLNAFDTTGLTEIVDLTGFCDPGAFGDDAIYNSAFFTYTPKTSGVYTLSTCNLAGFDTRLAVMEGCSPADGVVACNDDGPASCALFTSRIDAVELVAGVEYVVVVGGFAAADAGAGQLEISPFVPCELAQATVTEAEACGEDLNGGCNNAAGGFPTEPVSIGDVVAGEFWAEAGVRDTDWYLLTLTEGTEVTLSIRSSIECFAAVVGTECAAIIGDPTVGDCPGVTSVCLAPGQYYIVALPRTFEGFPCGGPAGNAYTLEVTGIPCDAAAPENDLCADATVAIEGANPFDNTFASTDVATPSCGFNGAPFLKDVWFSFTPSATGSYILETCSGSAPFDTGIELYDFCPEKGGTLLACNDDGIGCQFFSSQLSASLTEGVTYLIRVGGWAGETGATELVIAKGSLPGCGDPGTGDCCTANGTPFCEDAECCALICGADAFCCEVEWDQVCANQAIAQCTNCQVDPPANDECVNAVVIEDGATPFNTAGATGQTPACLKFGNQNVNNDIWFKYTPTGDGSLTISLCDATYDSKIAVFEGGCDGPLVACNDDFCGLRSELSFTPTCGTDYYISVGAFGIAGFGSGNVTITPSGKCGSNCPSDFDGNGQTDGADLAALLSGWGGPSGDVNGDGTTDGADLAALLSGWGACQ